MRMKPAVARPRYNPTNAIRKVVVPNTAGASHGETPIRPRLVPATILSALNGTIRPNTAHGRSISSGASVRHALMTRYKPYRPSPIAPTYSPVSPIVSPQ